MRRYLSCFPRGWRHRRSRVADDDDDDDDDDEGVEVDDFPAAITISVGGSGGKVRSRSDTTASFVAMTTRNVVPGVIFDLSMITLQLNRDKSRRMEKMCF